LFGPSSAKADDDRPTSGQADMIFDILVVIVVLNAMATIALWRTAQRKPETLKKKFVTALLSGDPIDPKHLPPKVISEPALSLVTDKDRRFFADFQDFADVVNWWLADPHVGTPWRLQELPDTDLKHDFSDMPEFGRRYDIYHGQVHAGTLEISPDLLAKGPGIRASIQLEWVRLLSVHTIRALLDAIVLHVCDTDQTTKEYVQAHAAIEGCLTNALWQVQQISEFDVDPGYGEIELQFNGSAVWYFERRQAPAFTGRR
jgi:hypothetical protein